VATVFMKWLERRPQAYDRGIRLLTLGRLDQLWDEAVAELIHPGDRVLELGCGTGRLASIMAQSGALVAAIDVSPAMLAVAKQRTEEAGLGGNIQFKRMNATQIGDAFAGESFDLIVTSLLLSELTSQEMDVVLNSCTTLLEPGGRFVLVDEVLPSGVVNLLKYYLLRIPLSALTWLLTRTSTRALKQVPQILSRHGFRLEKTSSRLGGSLGFFLARSLPMSDVIRHEAPVQRLQHRFTLRSLLIDLWALFFRIIPPYPKVKPDLYTVGGPDADAPLIVTGNFDLTVRRLLKAIDGRLDAWVLVLDSAGINVWCAAGGGFLTSDKVISALHSYRLKDRLHHRRLILPQFAAVGVDGWRIQEETGWHVLWGPVLADDLPAYLEAGCRKTEAMRSVCFPILRRLEMVCGTLGFYGLMLLIPIALFWRHRLLPTAIAMISLSIFYALLLPWLPGKDGLRKSAPLSLIALAGMLVYSTLWDPVTGNDLFNRVIGITVLSIFISSEFQGMSPLMRGEQANWGWEAVLGVCLGGLYWLVPRIVGWR
jgi:ubiquinone/menaquinone biosynthesis C-methylase UbiE